MKRIIIAFGALLFGLSATAQMTLEKDYLNVNSDVLNGADIEMNIINLSKSGYKYLAPDMLNGEIRIYNMNHSLWKTINVPTITNYFTETIQYVSEELFNTDSKVELALYYYSTIPNNTNHKILIINEDGNVLNTIDSAGIIKVFNVGNNTYKAIMKTGKEKFTVFNLPGTIPCDKCGNGLGLAKMGGDNSTGNISNPVPNPSNSQTTVEYTLPIGATSGVIDVYNMNGQKVK
ncbi:MAG: hypothetical protein H3C54_13855, partial [Taibaiella sp.]|nr:hypothetical protein [Taibaiella sp.]